MTTLFKNIIKPSLVIMTMLFNITILFAQEIPGVGIDWAESTMQVEFEKENIMVPDLTCFDVVTPPNVDCTPTGLYTACVDENLDTLGYSDTNSSPAIENCFHEAGNYQVTITLEDFAGNASAPIVSTFTVAAGSPDPDQSELEVHSCPIGASAPIANNDGMCTLYFKVKDQYGNPVSQLEAQEVNIYLDTLLSMDANNPNGDGSISFREGLIINDSSDGDRFIGDGVTTSPLKTTFELEKNYAGDLGIYKTLNFRALAPTLERVGEVLSKNEIFQLDFVFEVPSIDASGNVDLNIANNIEFRYGECPSVTKGCYSPSIQFRPMISSGVEVPGSSEFIIDVLKPMNILREIPSILNISNISNIVVGVTQHYLPWALKFDPSYFVNDPHSVDSSISFTTGGGAEPILPEDSPQSATVTVRVDTVDYTENLSFSSVISYSIDHSGTPYSVSYPGGAIGSGFGADCGEDPECDEVEITVKLIGASIEGSVLGETDTTKFGTDESATLVGGNQFTDIREDIFKNAHRITRSLEATTGNFVSTWFDTADVVLVNGDVKFENIITLPIGQKTLVIKNGNFIIDYDLTYANKDDSFGVILINDEVKPFPEKGNVIIRDSVKNIAGTFFLEGGVMTHDFLGPIPDIYDMTNGAAGNDTQLLWDGVILSHNTLGGGYESLYGGGTDYLTPWGLVNTLDDADDPGYEAWRTELSEASKAAEDLTIAKAYDLHMVRYYHPEYNGVPLQINGDKCVCKPSQSCTTTPGTGADQCDDNDNAFVIRTDGRMKQLPPPGFETVTTIKW